MEINSKNYADQAENVMEEFMKYDKNKNKLTTSKIRKFLALSQAIYDNAKFDKGNLSDEEISELQHLRVIMIYEAGRDKDGVVKEFIEKAKLLKFLKEIGDDREKLIVFCKYFEALVAYHRYYGGKDE